MLKESSSFREDAREYFLNSTALLKKSVEVLHNVKTLPQELHTLRELAVETASKQDELQGKILEGVSGILWKNAHEISKQAVKTMNKVIFLAANIRKLLTL